MKIELTPEPTTEAAPSGNPSTTTARNNSFRFPSSRNAAAGASGALGTPKLSPLDRLIAKNRQRKTTTAAPEAPEVAELPPQTLGRGTATDISLDELPDASITVKSRQRRQ